MTKIDGIADSDVEKFLAICVDADMVRKFNRLKDAFDQWVERTQGNDGVFYNKQTSDRLFTQFIRLYQVMEPEDALLFLSETHSIYYHEYDAEFREIESRRNLKAPRAEEHDAMVAHYNTWSHEEVGDEGWWRTSTNDTLLTTFLELTRLGMSVDDTTLLLSRIVGSMRSEYGE